MDGSGRHLPCFETANWGGDRLLSSGPGLFLGPRSLTSPLEAALRPQAPPQRGFEPWAWVAFALALATLILFVYLGSRPGGEGPIRAYRTGSLALGLTAALVLAGALFWCALKRPFLQRKRTVALACLGAVVWIHSFPYPYPSSHHGRPSAVAFRLPFRGAWQVLWGGEARTQNALVLQPDRRYGFEFIREDPDPILLAPAAGKIVLAREDAGPMGPFLCLRVAPEQFLVCSNLEPGSLLVGAGQKVEVGDELARIGPAPEPWLKGQRRLGVHLQDVAEPGRGEGIPMRFHRYRAGGREVDSGVPVGGLVDGGPGGQVVEDPAW